MEITDVSKPLKNNNRLEKLKSRLKREAKNYELWLFILPALMVLVLFKYVPMFGIQIAFKDFMPLDGIWGSKWVGLKHFERFFNSDLCWTVIRNTLVLSLYQIMAGFPLPIIFALLANQLTSLKFKKFVQTITYAPHFISTVVIAGMIMIFTAPSTGFIPKIIEAITGGEAPLLMGKPQLFPHMYVWSGIWQSLGWDAIIYIAALAGVSPELHEAATVDGASKLQRIWHIDVPAIIPTAITLLILNCGRVMSVGFEKVFLLQNQLNIDASQIISTYVYQVGLVDGQFSYSTAIGLFNSLVNFIILITVNKLSRKFSETSLW